jgi:hypothetical protein
MSRNKKVFLATLSAYFVVVLFTRKPDFFSGKIVNGKVIRIAERVIPRGDIGTSTIYVPDVEFIVAGETYTAMDYDAVLPPIYKEGDIVRVIYDPKEPRNCYIFSLIGYWINISELFIAALVLTIPAATYQALRKRNAGFMK